MSRTVLIADDEANLLNLLKDNLEESGYSVLTAADGEQALHLWLENRPDVIVLDIEMPRMDGWETLRLLRLDDATREIPVAMFTILFDLREKVRALKYGAQDYITKPFSVDDLIERVGRILGGVSAGEVEVR